MHRFYLPPALCLGTELTLAGPEAHHATDVLRLRRGDHVTVLNGAGDEFACEIIEEARRLMRLRVMHSRHSPPTPWQITLAQAVPKGKAMEWLLQKATELGVSRIVPLLTERTVPQLGGQAEGKLAKWQAITQEALKQCGLPWLPQLEAPMDLRVFLDRNERFDLSLVAALQPNCPHARAVFDNFQQAHQHPPARICVWIGPEGDFTPQELDRILRAGAQAITLGPQVLRSETAALYCLSVLSYELQARFAGAMN
jgi:16S rRNA (uracil1498-N3)-methyltransferase